MDLGTEETVMIWRGVLVSLLVMLTYMFYSEMIIGTVCCP